MFTKQTASNKVPKIQFKIDSPLSLLLCVDTTLVCPLGLRHSSENGKRTGLKMK